MIQTVVHTHCVYNVYLSNIMYVLPLKLKKVVCLIQDVVSPHCGNKRWPTLNETFSAELL